MFPAGTGAANLANAIGCYPKALRFYTAEAVPAECRLTARGLGDVHFGQGRWVEAHAAYSSAIRAGEFLYQATGSEAGRQAELGEAGDAVAADAYCLARLGQLGEAVRRLEAGRARGPGRGAGPGPGGPSYTPAPKCLGISWIRPASPYQRNRYRPLGPWPQTETPASKITWYAIMFRAFPWSKRWSGAGSNRRPSAFQEALQVQVSSSRAA